MSAPAYAPETYPNTWLPADASFKSWEAIEPWFAKLEAWPIRSAEDLEAWLTALGELGAAVAQERETRHIAMTCQTDDPAREAAHLDFVRNIEPKLKPVLDRLRRVYLDSPHRAGLPKDRYFVFDRAWENRRSLFREANVPRETELAELGQQYQKAIGAMTVTHKGEEKTLAQMGRLLEETDRQLRQEAWELVVNRRLQDRDALDSIFDRMIALRDQIAKEAGFPDYVAYAYRERERFDYGPEQAAAFQESIERAAVPALQRLLEGRRKALGLETLRPWDTAVDPAGRPPLRPFQEADRLAEGTQSILEGVDPELAAQFAFLRGKDLLDLPNRKGKAPGGYQTTLEADRLPFIFMNAVGVDDDVRTLLHEAGHAFHTLAARGEPLFAYRDAPIEFCEVASMTMELFGARDLGTFYDSADADRSYRQLLEGIVKVLPWIATVDAFQHWIYKHPGHTREERMAYWSSLMDRFGGGVDWSGYEEARGLLWHRQLHIFLYPFYYIEYGIAQLGALQIWLRSRKDKREAVAGYRSGLALGGSKPLPELFAAAGAKFDFSEATIRPLIAAIEEELAAIPA